MAEEQLYSVTAIRMAAYLWIDMNMQIKMYQHPPASIYTLVKLANLANQLANC